MTCIKLAYLLKYPGFDMSEIKLGQSGEIITRLSQQGYRPTPQRMMILEVVEEADSHISAHEICTRVREHYPNMNISTVYRTLELLEGLGLVTKTDLGDGKERYHSIRKGHHHHLVCQKCGAIIGVAESITNPLWAEILEQYDFKVNMKHLVFFGLCSRCRR